MKIIKISNIFCKIFFFKLFFLFLLAIPSFAQNDEGRIDLVIVLDVSGSMRSNHLVGPVRETFNQTLDRLLTVGDTVTLITFGTASYSPMATVVVESPQSTQQLKDYVASLEFNDQKTYHALAIQSAFEKCEILEREYPQHERVILFLTDGRNDPPEGPSDEIALHDVRVNSSAYNTDWFVVHIQMHDQENSEVGGVLDGMFGDHYLYSPRVEDAFSQLEALLQSFIFVDYDPSRNISISISERDTEFSGYTDLFLSTSSSNEIPIEQICFLGDFPDLPSSIDISYDTEVLSDDKLRVFVRVKLMDDLSPNEYHGFYGPVLENEESWQIGGSIQNILVDINVAVSVDTVYWGVEPDELALEVAELQLSYQTQLEISNIPFGLDTSLVSMQFDSGNIPSSVTMDCIIDHSIAGKAVVTITAFADSEVSNGDYNGSVLIGLRDTDDFAADRLEIPFLLKTSIIPSTWPKTLGIVGGSILLLGAGVFFLRRYQKSKLFGTFLYWSTENPGTRKRKNISKFGASGEIGNKGVVIPQASKKMASLKVTIVNGNRFVTIFPEPGVSLTLKDRKQASIKLHNHDVFHLDGWGFEYKGSTVKRKQARR